MREMSIVKFYYSQFCPLGQSRITLVPMAMVADVTDLDGNRKNRDDAVCGSPALLGCFGVLLCEGEKEEGGPRTARSVA